MAVTKTNKPHATKEHNKNVNNSFVCAWRGFKFFWYTVYEKIKWFLSKLIEKISSFSMGIFCSKNPNKFWTNHLLEKAPVFSDSQKEWLLNLALLKSPYENAKDPDVKKRIEFLATNYLNKVAPLNLDVMGKYKDDFEKMFQMSPLANYRYHRYGFRHNNSFSKSINKDYALGDSSPMIATNTGEFSELLPLSFTVLNTNSLDKWSESIVNSLEQHFSKNSWNTKKSLSKSIKPRLLIDASTTLNGVIKTNSSAEKESEFNKVFTELERKSELAISHAVKLFIEKNKSKSISEKSLLEFVKLNSTSICRLDIEDDLGAVKILPLYSSINDDEWLEKHHAFNDFLGNTGLFLGAITMRRYNQNVFKIGQNVNFKPKGKSDTLYFPRKQDFIGSAMFRRSKEKYASPELQQKFPHISILGRATNQLIEGLFNEVTDAQWKALNKDPINREILQTTLFRLREHLANGEIFRHDFTLFTQYIELAHSELAVLLELIQPFKDSDFEPLYKQNMTHIPEKWKPHLRAGLGVTGTNIFAGICSSVLKINPNPNSVSTKEFYFEQKDLVNSQGKKHHYENVINDKSNSAVDLYACGTNFNIEPESTFVHYPQTNIIENLKKLLKEKKDTKHLTVAIDATIDPIFSKQIKTILETFDSEINEGKLNFVIFSSGQKFDMFGLDNYYAGHFYMVNNGDKTWKSFEDTFFSGKKAHKPDNLSMQWFSLLHKYAFDPLKEYRNQIFDNTRQLLNQVPEFLKPKNKNDEIFVCTTDPKMDACFIDIRFRTEAPVAKIEAEEQLQKLYKKCSEKGVKIHFRSSFGFHHMSATLIPDTKYCWSIRLTLGLNPKENAVVLDFLKELA